MRVYQRALLPLRDALLAVISNLPCPESVARAAMQDIDFALRAALGAELRPYQLEPADGGHELTYSGAALTRGQQVEARAFVDWLRHRDA